MAGNFLKRNNQSEPTAKNNRLYYLSAIIFLLLVAVIARLYQLQIIEHERYLAKADQQHNIYSQLKAQRGKIYLENNAALYPIALSKDFASVYINPRALSQEEIKSFLLFVYQAFHQKQVEEEIDRYLAEQETQDFKNELDYINSLQLDEVDREKKKREAETRRQELKNNAEWLEFQKIKRDLEIGERRENIISGYFNKVNVADKYSRLVRRKIDKDDLLQLYFLALKDRLDLASSSDLSLKDGRIFQGEQDLSDQIKGVSFSWETLRYYPEKNLFSSILGFVNLDGLGNYGLEAYFNQELSGQDGYLLGDQGSYKGEKIVIDQDEYQAPVNGQSLVLTLDYAVQLQVCQKLSAAQAKHNFSGGSIIVMNPKSGAIVALCSWPDFDPNNYQVVDKTESFDNQAVAYQYEPGSIFKTITLAAAIDQGRIGPDTYYQDEGQVNIKGWSKPIKNSDYEVYGGHGRVDMNYVLEHSLNTGAIFAANQIGAEGLADYLKKFGFGQKTGIELSSEIGGNISNLLKSQVKDIDLATASFGQGLAVTPLQMLAAYGALANEGVLMKPYIIDRILDSKGEVIKKNEGQAVRAVVSKSTAETISAMLVNVVEKGHAQRSKVAGYYIGGKTGTAQIPSAGGGYISNKYIHTFVGYGPIEDPRFVMLVKFDSPDTSVYAEGTVVPVFGEIVDFLLKYYQIPASRDLK